MLWFFFASALGAHFPGPKSDRARVQILFMKVKFSLN